MVAGRIQLREAQCLLHEARAGKHEGCRCLRMCSLLRLICDFAKSTSARGIHLTDTQRLTAARMKTIYGRRCATLQPCWASCALRC